eukprot:TRINITY_DN10812_c0_g1_i1.p1 TRINITY_DN10812_c0_g1~~TRINITY_DN10812_c0_g1_i1.p1  ORF type:complete len:974 (+),score=174.85 TRINITY_DN10812_c0_g1_i1:51-2972(+)
MHTGKYFCILITFLAFAQSVTMLQCKSNCQNLLTNNNYGFRRDECSTITLHFVDSITGDIVQFTGNVKLELVNFTQHGFVGMVPDMVGFNNNSIDVSDANTITFESVCIEYSAASGTVQLLATATGLEPLYLNSFFNVRRAAFISFTHNMLVEPSQKPIIIPVGNFIGPQDEFGITRYILDEFGNVVNDSRSLVLKVSWTSETKSPAWLLGGESKFENGIARFPNLQFVGEEAAIVQLEAVTDPLLPVIRSNQLYEFACGDLKDIGILIMDRPSSILSTGSTLYEVPLGEKVEYKIIGYDIAGNALEISNDDHFQCNSNGGIVEGCQVGMDKKYLTFDKTGDFKLLFTVNMFFSGIAEIKVKELSEYNCFTVSALDKLGKHSITKTDIIRFNEMVINDEEVSSILVSEFFDTTTPYPDIFKINFHTETEISEHATILDKQWILSRRRFFLEIDHRFLSAVSLMFLPKKPVELNVTLPKALCGSMDQERIRGLMVHWFSSLVERHLKFHLGEINAYYDDEYDPENVGFDDGGNVICLPHGNTFRCCSRADNSMESCNIVDLGLAGRILIATSILLSLVVAIASSIIVAYSLKSSDLLSPHGINDWDEPEIKKRGRTQLLLVILVPIILLVSLLSFFFSFNDSGIFITIISTLFAVTALWYFIGLLHWATVFKLKVPVPYFLTKAFVFSCVLMTFLSSGLFALIFTWVSLSLLVNPLRIVPIFSFLISLIASISIKYREFQDKFLDVKTSMVRNLLKSGQTFSIIPGLDLTTDNPGEFYDVLQRFGHSSEEANRIISQIGDYNSEVTLCLEKPFDTEISDFRIWGMLDMNSQDLEKELRGLSIREGEMIDIISMIVDFNAFERRFILMSSILSMFIITLLSTFILIGISAFTFGDDYQNMIGSGLIVLNTIGAHFLLVTDNPRKSATYYMSHLLRKYKKIDKTGTRFSRKLRESYLSSDNWGNELNVPLVHIVDD